jgi:hypothetical protein
MVASAPGNIDGKTFLSPGQKFASAEISGLGSEPLTVARLVTDRYGMLHVTMRTGSGREISAFVEQVEMAVSEGHLVPVSPALSPIAC